MSSILTGFPNLDSLIGGFQPADMLLLASPSSTKLTDLALSVVLNVAIDTHHRVGIFTSTMNKYHLVQRLLALSTGIDLHRLYTGAMTIDEYNHLAIRARILSHAKIWINDSADLSVLQFQQQVQAMVKAHGITFLLIDNIYCLRFFHTRHQHAYQNAEMGETSNQLKMLAKVLNIPVLVLAPYTSLKANTDVADGPSSHRDRSTCEKIPDHALFLYRENLSQHAVQDKSRSLIPLRVVNQHNGFVTNIALFSQQGQSVPPVQNNAAS